MNWGECKLIALQTMYANEGERLNADDTNQEYLDAMPGKANEALNQIALVGRPILRQLRISVGGEKGELALPVTEGVYKIQLLDYAPNFRAVDRLLVETADSYGDAETYDIEGDTTLVIPGYREGEYTLWYKAYPKQITHATPDDEQLELTADAAYLVPIYMAAELYKDDSLALSQTLRNEYEDGLEKLRAAYSETGAGISSVNRRNLTGWW